MNYRADWDRRNLENFNHWLPVTAHELQSHKPAWFASLNVLKLLFSLNGEVNWVEPHK